MADPYHRKKNYFAKTEIYVANAGDSRCYLSKDKKAHPMSKDHKPDDEYLNLIKISEKKKIESSKLEEQ